MHKKTMIEALNLHMNREFFASYLYLSMSAYFARKNLSGMAAWMKLQAKEELEHALKFFDFINELGAAAMLQAVAAPTTDWEGPLAVFQDAYAHEQEVTGYVHELYSLAARENDYATQVFLQWFIKEQVEEEATVSSIIERFQLGAAHPSVVLLMDRELGARAGGH